jgi:hypothetical protein
MFFKKPNAKELQDNPMDQAVIVSLHTDQENQHATQEIVSHITDKCTEHDGDEYGDNECNLYLYGSSAEEN